MNSARSRSEKPPVLGDTLLPYILSLQDEARRPAVARLSMHARLRLTRGELLAAARQVAAWLDGCGLEAGDRVLLQAGGGPLWVAGFFGCLLRGVVAVPLDAKLPACDIPDYAARVDVRAGMIEGSGKPLPTLPWLDLDVLRHAEGGVGASAGSRRDHAPDPDDLVEIVFTSGTTGRPRAVPITHRNLLASLHPIERGWRKRRKWVDRIRPRLACAVPPSHLFGQVVGILIPILMGLPVVFLDDLRPRAVREALRREKVMVAITVPRLLALLRADLVREGLPPFPLADAEARWWRKAWRARRMHRALGWRFVAWVSGGAALDEEVESFWHRCGYLVVQGYGLTETAPIISVSNPFARRRGTVGKPLSSQEVRVGDDGELWVRGDNVASGYLDDPEATAQVFSEGWLRTGDRVERDENGVLRIKGRVKDIIVTADGVNIDPGGIEKELEQQEGVREAAVIAAAGSRGEEVHAVLVLDGERAPDEIVRAANTRLGTGQRVQGFSVWPSATLPRTSTGKLQRARLREAVTAERARADPPHLERAPHTDSADPVAEALASLTGRSVESLQQDVELDGDLGLSSLDRLDLLVRLEETTGRSLDESAVATARSLGDLTAAASRPPAPPITMPRWSRRAPAGAVRTLARNVFVAPIFHGLFRLHVGGREHLADLVSPFLIVANHESHLDTAAILFALPGPLRRHMAVAMATEHFPAVFDRPAMTDDTVRRDGAWRQRLAYLSAALLFNAYPLPRHGGFSVTLDYTGELIDAGNCPLIYPEGRMRHAGEEEPPPFRDGPSVLARDLHVPVVPAGIAGAGRGLPPRSRRPRPGRVVVRFGVPLRVEHDETREIGRFTRRLEAAVRSLVGEGRVPANRHAPD